MYTGRAIGMTALLLILPFISAAAATPSISPYLDYHTTDRVRWQPWNLNTLQQAKLSQKLILVSSGYFACHYCHVMKRESYDDPEIANYINTHFIPVIIDREVHTALDSQLMQFMDAMGAPQGWPLHVILTPEAQPLTGMVYRPPSEFLQSLQQIHTRWRQDPAKWRHSAQQAVDAMVARLTVPAFIIENGNSAGFVEALYEQALLVADREHGGFGFEAKYPLSPQLLALLRLQNSYPRDELKQHLSLTLRHMASSDLMDALGNGFFRYATRRDWRLPHYEKMLYDNAQLALVYLEAAHILNDPAFYEVATNTLDFMLRDFRDQDGFIASLSAVDVQGRDGGYYLWTDSILKKLLNAEEYAVVTRLWQPVSGHDEAILYLPRKPDDAVMQAGHVSMPDTRLRSLLMSVEKKLNASRQQREIPRDDKRLAGWNGLTLLALSTAAMQPGNERYRHRADALYRFIASELWRDGRLQRTSGGGDAELADYAYVAAGVLAYAGVSGQVEHRAFGARVTTQAWHNFYIDGVWRLTDNPDLVLPFTVYQVILPDAEMFSPTAMLIATTLGLDDAINHRYRTLASRALYTVDAGFVQSPFFYASQIQAMVTHDAPR